MNVLVTGGAGLIGSVVSTALINRGYTPIIIDSLAAGDRRFLKNRLGYVTDICDIEFIIGIVKKYHIKSCIHLAAKISVEESVRDPLLYYKENVAKSIKLFEALKRNNVNKIIFSSSASVYDASKNFEVTEESPLNPLSPYANTKMIMEMILKDSVSETFKAISLRYFNLIGACKSGFSGPYDDNPSHLLGMLIKAKKENKPFTIFGDDWGTRDKTTIRDFIHVQDLADAHVLALDKFEEVTRDKNYEVINLGTGKGTTVKEFVSAFIKVAGEIEVKYEKRRAGDVIGAYTNTQKAEELLGFKAKYSIEEGIEDTFKWLEK